MRVERMELIGVVVDDLDAAVARYSDLFGLEFVVFTPGVDYALTGASSDTGDPTPLPGGIRMAMDTSGCFELIGIPGAEEGVRNIHFRVDDMEAAIEQFVSRGLPVVQDLRAGTVREVIFDSRELNGVRMCLVHYKGPSFAEALAASPAP